MPDIAQRLANVDLGFSNGPSRSARRLADDYSWVSGMLMQTLKGLRV